MEIIVYPQHPFRSIITGPICSVKSIFLTNLILIILNEYSKVYIFSPSLHQGLYHNLNKCFSIYIPIHIIRNILNKEDIDVVIDEIVNKKDFENSDTEIETYESMEELKYPQEYDDGVLSS